MKLSLFLFRIGIDVRSSLMKEIREAFGGELRYIFVGGAVLDPYYEREFRAWGIELITAYGATECSPGIAANRNFHHREGAVGRAIECCQLRIAEDGEVLIRGENVMMGYYHDEEGTAEVLKDGWYASGDIGYLDDDGFLFLTGRKKNLIITNNGKNFSPEVVEGKISEIPYIKECIVTTKEKNNIVAKVYIEEPVEESVLKSDIRKINKTLPKFMHIDCFEIMQNEFEKNSSKKIRREKYVEQF